LFASVPTGFCANKKTRAISGSGFLPRKFAKANEFIVKKAEDVKHYFYFFHLD